MIDRRGLNAVLADLTHICNEKAEHIRTHWQDESLARAWERAARRIETTISKIEI